MISIEFRKYQENKFDVFCKVVIRNACTDNRRSRMKREKRFSSLEAMQMDALELEQVEDVYITYSRTFRVKGIEIMVIDEQIGEALQHILPNQRAILLLSFFKDYSDSEISRFLKISRKTVAYQKARAIDRLKSQLEGMRSGT